MFKVNTFECIQVLVSYDTLADFVKAVGCFGTLSVTVKFVILSTLHNSIKKRLYTPSG